MPYMDFGIADFNQTSYFKSWTGKDGDGTIHHGYTTPSSNTQTKGVTVSGIPAGATITAYNVYFNVDTGTYGGTHTPASGASVDPSNISFYWQSNTGGSYPSAPAPNKTNYQDKTGLCQRTGIYVRVTYTDPESPPDPPPPGESDLAISTQHINAGDTLTAYIGPRNAAHWHQLYIFFGVEQYGVGIPPGTNSTEYTIPMDWLKQIPNAPYGTGEVYLYTYNGETLVGARSIALYIYAPASVVPTLTGVTATLASNGVNASITRYVQYYSKCALSITGAAGAYDSTISSYKITGGGFTVNAASGTLGPFGTTGNLTFTATVTDSRGRTASATVTITVDAYNLPSLTDISAFRCDVNGTADRRGGYVLLKATPAIASIGEQNSAALAGRVYMKGGTPGTPETMVSNTASILGGGLLLPVKTYMAEIIVQDLINTYAYTATIPTDVVGLHILDKSLGGGIGKYGETPGMMEVAWPLSAPSLYGHSNILHNPDFRNPVNQRAVTGAISTAGYFYDRWLLNSGTVTTNAAYLTIGAAAEIEQRIEGNLLAGETVTVSVMVGGTVYSGTGIMPTSGTASVTLTGWGTATLGYATGYMYVRLAPTAASNVVRVKLEFGTVSTLAYDAPTDHAVELPKCQRFYRVIATYLGGYCLSGFCDGTTTVRFLYYSSCPFRGPVTVSISGILPITGASGALTGADVASVSQAFSDQNNSTVTLLCTAAFAISAGTIYVGHYEGGGRIALSSDL